MQPEQRTAIEHSWRKRPAPVYRSDRDRGLNATADVLALVEALHQAWRQRAALRRRLPDTQPTYGRAGLRVLYRVAAVATAKR
jgi:hypothetical protein